MEHADRTPGGHEQLLSRAAADRADTSGPRVVRCALLALAGYLIGAVVLNVAVDWRPHIQVYSEKLEFYQENRDRFSVLFLGSSRIYRHIDPRVFDRTLAEAGHAVESFNLGMDALSVIELKTLVEIIAADPPARLRHAFIEPCFVTNLPLKNLATDRAVYFHTLENTSLVVLANLRSPRYRTSIGRNLLACLYHYAALGKLASALQPRAPPVCRSRTDLGSSLGFLPLDDDPDPAIKARHGAFLAALPHLEPKMRDPDPLPERFGEMYAVQNEVMIRIARRLRAAGVEPIFLHSPGFAGVHVYTQFESFHGQRAHDLELVSYLRSLPDLFEGRYWYDAGHLNAEGARHFTRRLAQDFAGRLKAAGARS